MIDLNAISTQVDAMHLAYCTAVGFKLPPTLSHRERWERLIHAGYTLDQVEMVLRYWKRQIAGGMNAGVLRFSRLLDLDTFAEDVCLAHADKARHKPMATAKEQAMRELRPQACEPTNGKTAVQAREAAVNMLENLKRTLSN